MHKNIIIVDPGPSAAYLAESLKQLGLNSIAIFTAPMESRDEYFRVATDVFDQQIFVDNASAEKCIAAAQALDPIFILNGSDDSAPITDRINTALLPGFANDPKTAVARCNKFNMQTALKAQGLPYIQQVRIARKDISSLDLTTIRFPCFCKPVHGICTVGGFKAENAHEFTTQMQKYVTHAKVNQPDYLIQEFIHADEYVVDTFSYQGKHYISSIQKYQKRLVGNTPTYGYCEVVDDKAAWEACAYFVKQCLDATGLHNGFCHTEIFALSDGSYRLIEVNPRISGIKGYYNKLAHLLSLNTQPELLAQCLSAAPQESTFDQKKEYGRFLCLYNFSEKALQDPGKKLTHLASVKFYNLLKPVGTLPNDEPKNLATTDLLVMLAHRDLSVIEHDTHKLFELESSHQLL